MRVLAWLGALAVLIVLVAGAAVLFPGTWLPPLVEARLADRLGRAVEVADADLSLTEGTVVLSGLRVANPDWAPHPWLLTVDRLEADVPLGRALTGNLAIRRLEVDQPTLHLDRDEAHGASWPTGRQGTGAGAVQRLEVRGGRVTYVHPAAGTDLSGTFASRPDQDRLHVAATGTWRGQKARLEGWTARLVDLRDAEEVPLGFDLAVGGTSATGQGSLRGLSASGGPYFTLDLEASGPSLDAWRRIAGARLPPSPPYALAGRLSWDGRAYSVRDASGTIGDSEVAGRLTVTPGPVTRIAGDLDGDTVTLDDILALGGGRAETGGGGLPAGLALDLTVAADDLVTGLRPLTQVETRVVLDDRHLRLDPFAAATAGGRVSGRLDLDAGPRPPRAGGRLRLEGLRLDSVLGAAEVTADGLRGRLGGHLEVAGDWTGSVDGWLASLDGQGGLVVSDGRLGTDRLKAAGLGLGDLLGGDEAPARIRCAVVEATIQNGVARPSTAVLSATSAVVRADGEVDLGARRWDLTLSVEPRQGTDVVDAVAVRGPLLAPRVETDTRTAAVAGRAVAGAALAAVATPLAGLLPLLAAGEDDAPGCHAILAQVQQAEGTAARGNRQREDAD